MEKVYKGTEILQMIENGKLKLNSKLISEYEEDYIFEKDKCLEDGTLYKIDRGEKIIPGYYEFISTDFRIIENEVNESKEVEELKEVREIKFIEGQYPGQKIEILQIGLNEVIKVLNKIVKEKKETNSINDKEE